MAEISVQNDLNGGGIDPTHGALGQMPTAKLLQPYGDIWAGHYTDGNAMAGTGGNDVGGIQLITWNGTSRLLATVYADFQTQAQTRNTHFILSTNTSSPALIAGPFEIRNGSASTAGCMGGNCPESWVAGSMTPIPPTWQSDLGGDMLTGQCCISLISRTSYGVTATRFTLADLASNPVVGKRLVAYPQGHTTLGNWTSNAPGGGTKQYSAQGDVNRMIWPDGYRSLLFFYVLGDNDFNCYGSAVAADADGDPVTDGMGEQPQIAPGANASTSANGQVITLPNVNVSQIDLNGPHRFIQLTDQTAPTYTYCNRHYTAMAKIVSVANSGTPTASVTVSAADAFTGNLSNQHYRIGEPSVYDPDRHNTPTAPDNEPNAGHGPSAYPYQVVVYSYDANDLAAVNAGAANTWQPVPRDQWTLTLPVDYPGGKYAHQSIGAVAYDRVHRKIYVTQTRVSLASETIVLVYRVPGVGSAPALCASSTVAGGIATVFMVIRRRRSGKRRGDIKSASPRTAV